VRLHFVHLLVTLQLIFNSTRISLFSDIFQASQHTREMFITNEQGIRFHNAINPLA
jgi:hypothetical protein